MFYVALFIASSERNSQDGEDTLACARDRIRAAYAALQDAIKYERLAKQANPYVSFIN